jgi:hypothetical protein
VLGVFEEIISKAADLSGLLYSLLLLNLRLVFILYLSRSAIGNLLDATEVLLDGKILTSSSG